jgi:hypothetical protein
MLQRNSKALIIGLMLLCIGCVDEKKENIIVDNSFVACDSTAASVEVDTVEFIPEFGVKIVTFSTEYYAIHFSNDGFITYDDIKRVIDLTDGPDDWVYLRYQVHLFEYDELWRARQIASKLDSYEKCLQYNRRQFQRKKELLERYKDNPTYEEYQAAKRKKNGTSNRPKEIIIR